MGEDQNGKRNQQSDSKPNHSLTDKSQGLLKENSSINLQAAGKKIENTTFQRRPQFRLTENCKKRYI